MKKKLMLAAVIGLATSYVYANTASTTAAMPAQTISAQNMVTQKPVVQTTTNNQPAAPAVAPIVQSGTQKLTSELDRLSYAIGFNIGKGFKSQEIVINPNVFSQGIQAGLANGQGSLMTPEEVRQTLMDFQQTQMQKQQQELTNMSKKNQAINDSFFAQNKTKSGVVTLANGLQYKILEVGKGAKPTINDEVKVDYEGKLLNGKVFDSSYQRGTPATFPVTAVIPGWTQILQLMPVGSTWEVYIPAQLAYGNRGAGNVIEPGSALIFKIHLIGIENKPATNSPKK